MDPHLSTTTAAWSVSFRSDSDPRTIFGQRTSGVLMGLDLVRWWGPRARLDLCHAYPNGGIAGCPGSNPAPPPPTAESVKVVAANVSATEDGEPQATFVSAPQFVAYLQIDFAAPTKQRHTFDRGPQREHTRLAYASSLRPLTGTHGSTYQRLQRVGSGN